jgi:transcriptional regulator with XRE-family HTH domain
MSTPLDTYMRAHGLLGGAIAEQLGVSEPTLSKLRRGKQRPSIEQAVALARITQGEVPVEAWVGTADATRGPDADATGATGEAA